jgi:tetratricopeptide (TPR) repeat protein
VREALRILEATAQEFPDDADALNQLAWLLVSTRLPQYRDPARGADVAEKAVFLARPSDSPYRARIAMYLDTLARAWFEQGKWQKAVETQEEALRSAPPSETQLRAQLAGALQRYKEKLQEEGK